MSVTETTRISWGSRLGSSFKGILFGLVLFVAGFPFLFWNEGNAVKTAKAIDEGEGACVSLESNEKVDPEMEGKLVHLTGKGQGGRNQELALSAAAGIDGMENVAVFSLGSDGTDGPTDAAGGWVDGTTAARLREQGVQIYDVLKDNDAYKALKKVDGLIITGPTGTNVNDVSVLLIRGKK